MVKKATAPQLEYIGKLHISKAEAGELAGGITVDKMRDLTLKQASDVIAGRHALIMRNRPPGSIVRLELLIPKDTDDTDTDFIDYKGDATVTGYDIAANKDTIYPYANIEMASIEHTRRASFRTLQNDGSVEKKSTGRDAEVEAFIERYDREYARWDLVKKMMNKRWKHLVDEGELGAKLLGISYLANGAYVKMMRQVLDYMETTYRDAPPTVQQIDEAIKERANFVIHEWKGDIE